GAGPRAAQALMLATRARALIDGRLSPSTDDVKALALPVLKHRMALTFAARAEGETVPNIVAKLVGRLA
ncbi:AAA family ATPase, partial [Lichenihabitans sp. Uapishka_5]|nr:AAA family ATPase [Lichenihabitans sp. Uapishka_5]